MQQGRPDAARRQLEQLVKEAPAFTAAHVTLATVYYRLKRKTDGDRERAIVEKLTAETQVKQQQGVNVK
jgi:Tfp pilus assembly protein PilF